jgi:hypothetical protein
MHSWAEVMRVTKGYARDRGRARVHVSVCSLAQLKLVKNYKLYVSFEFAAYCVAEPRDRDRKTRINVRGFCVSQCLALSDNRIESLSPLGLYEMVFLL